MSSLPCIFVSHSSKDNPLTRQLCEALRGDDAASAQYELAVDFEKLQHYDVLVDIDELQAGKPWPKQLHEWMARCNMAVLLLTANAVKSPWVLKEATILAWRLSLDTSFRFVTVRFADVSDADLSKGGFDPLILGEIQTLAGGDVAYIAAEVGKALSAAVVEETPFDSLCAALEDLAQDVKPNTLRTLGEKMGVPRAAWRPDVDQRQLYVRAIAASLLSEGLGGYGGTHQLVKDLVATTSTETVKKILDIVAPYWVDAEAAGQLPLLAAKQPHPAIAIDGACVARYTADMYVRKAYGLDRLQRVLPIPSGNAGDLVDHIMRELYRRAIRAERTGGGSGALSAEQLAEATRHYDRSQLQHFVVLSKPYPAPDQMTELAKHFPKLVFLLWTDSGLLDGELKGVVRLRPPVAVDEEERQYAAYLDARELIDPSQ